MRKTLWGLNLNLVIMECFLGLIFARKGIVEEMKAEAAMPITTLSPPEGNTTFLGGTTWCVARPGASQVDLKIALDWACGLGKANCRPIRAGGPCFQPDTLLSHATYAFNNYYQQNGNSILLATLEGLAILTRRNPSYGRCSFASSESLRSSSASSYKFKSKSIYWKIVYLVLMLLYLSIN